LAFLNRKLRRKNLNAEVSAIILVENIFIIDDIFNIPDDIFFILVENICEE